MGRVKRDFISQVIIYILLFLIGLNLNTNAVLFCYILAFFSFLYGGIGFSVPKISIFVILLAFLILSSQIINNLDISIYTILKIGVYPIMFFAFYRIGKGIIRDRNNTNEIIHIFFLMIFFFALGNVIHIVLDLSITDLPNINTGRRILNDIWTGGTVVATIVAGWGCITPALFMYTFEKRKKRKFLFIISLLSVLVCVVFSLVFATRLLLVNFIIIIIVFLFLLIKQQDISVNISKFIRILLAFVIIAFVAYKLLPLILSSNLFERLSGESLSLFNSNGRIEATIYLLNNFTDALWGGEYFTNQYGLQQHNVLFQMYDLYGLFPFALWGLLFINSIKRTVKVAKSHFVNNSEKRFIILLFISLTLFYFEEPAISSNYIITSILFAFIGFVCAIQKSL